MVDVGDVSNLLSILVSGGITENITYDSENIVS